MVSRAVLNRLRYRFWLAGIGDIYGSNLVEALPLSLPDVAAFDVPDLPTDYGYYSYVGLVIPRNPSNIIPGQYSNLLPIGILTAGYASNYGGSVSSTQYGLFTPSNPAHAGVIFDIDGQFHAGAIKLHVSPDAIQILGWQYESVADTPFHIPNPDGRVPEPSSLAVLSGLSLLAAGAAGIRERRRRKQVKPQSA